MATKYRKNRWVTLDLGIAKFNLLNYWHVVFIVSVAFLIAALFGVIKV